MREVRSYWGAGGNSGKVLGDSTDLCRSKYSYADICDDDVPRRPSVKHRSYSSYSKAIAALVVLLLATITAIGQAISGNLTGTILDASGAALNGATVEAVNVATGQKATTTSRGSGGYFFSNLPVGTYRISATASGFKNTSIDNVNVELNKSNTLNIKLELGTSTTTV